MREDNGRETAREQLDRLEREIQLNGPSAPDTTLMPDGVTTLAEARKQFTALADEDGKERQEANAERFREQAREEELAAGDVDLHHDPRTGVTHIVPAGEAVSMSDDGTNEGEAANAVSDALPEGFPGKTELVAAGYTTLSSVRALTSAERLAIKGISKVTNEQIAAALLPADGSSSKPASSSAGAALTLPDS